MKDPAAMSLVQLANDAGAYEFDKSALYAAQSGKLKEVKSLMQLANAAAHLPTVRQAARSNLCHRKKTKPLNDIRNLQRQVYASHLLSTMTNWGICF